MPLAWRARLRNLRRLRLVPRRDVYPRGRRFSPVIGTKTHDVAFASAGEDELILFELQSGKHKTGIAGVNPKTAEAGRILKRVVKSQLIVGREIGADFSVQETHRSAQLRARISCRHLECFN